MTKSRFSFTRNIADTRVVESNALGYFTLVASSARPIAENKLCRERLVAVSPRISIGWKRLDEERIFENGICRQFLSMQDTVCKKHLEDAPILNDHCSVNLTSKPPDNSTEHGISKVGWKNNKYYRAIQTIQSLLIVLVLCFAAFLIYSSMSDRTFLTLDEANQHLQTNNESTEAQETERNFRDRNRQFYNEEYNRLSPSELRTILLSTMDLDRRKRRHLDANLCKQNMEHCKIVMDSMMKIVNTVNNSMPHLLEFLKNFPTDKDAPKSKLVELVECLQCKNDSITFIDETGPDNLMNEARTIHENRDQIKSNVDTVCNLLDEPNSNLVDVSKSGREGAKKLAKWTFVDSSDSGDRKEDLDEMETTSSWTSSTMKYESKNAWTEAESAETTSMAEETIAIDDTKGIAINANVTAKPDDGNVTEITIEQLHPSVQPSIQGHGQGNETEREGLEGSSPQMKMRGPQSRIVTKGNAASIPGMIPTAETMKSSQQLVLTPTISWIPYQICFFGMSNPTKQSGGAAQQTMYGASSPAEIGYPIWQHRQGYQNTNHAPNYVQVQAQSVQFFPGNYGQNGGQKIGPTGPAIPNFPIFPRQQSLPGGNANSKIPYYCTFIPTFQFPTVPGMNEYQRSSVNFKDKKEDDSDKEDENPGSCPFNMIRCNDEKRCIYRTQWCDGLVDCYDASDETTCSCRDRISQERICDGYFDCPQGEDELGCLGCPKTSFSCNDWQRRYSNDNCVPLYQRCDGVKNCANGKDEMECNILTPSFVEGENVFTIGYIEGYLHKNFKGQWYPVCTVVKSWIKDACISEIGHDISEYPEVNIHSMPPNAYQGPYIAEVNGRIKLVPSCMDTAVFVRCPRFPCGTSAFSHEDSLEPHVLEKEERDTFQIFDELVHKNRMNFDENGDKDDMVGSQLRVVGGRASQPKAWPFLVAIYKNGIFCCGGVILNEMWILTAAHCLEGYTGHYFEIQAGILRRHSFSPMSQIRRAGYTVMHPRYNGKDMKNDIGMIKLDDPLHFNRWIRQVCLPGKDILGPMWRNKPEPNSTCIAIGWGALREYGPDPDHLREVEVPILKNCKYEVDQNEAAICAGYPQGGRDACQGDSGGPLLCRNPYSESQWYVAGIISHGEGCARPNEPGAYTRVSYFLDWIQEEISNDQGIFPLRRTPLKKCPGFSCEGGLGKCLPVEARCNRVIDCLDGEDELNCHHYPIYRQLGNASFETVPSSTMESPDDPTKPDEIFTSASPLFDDTSYKPSDRSEGRANNELGSEGTTWTTSNLRFDDDPNATSTTSSSSYIENASSITSTRFPTIFTCSRLLQSVSIEKRCDRVVDCEDSTDELNCTCKDYLQNLRPTAICDGYADCDDLTDERDCEICGKNEFLCSTSKTCVSMSKKCDGKFDCEFKEDELDCFAFTDGHRVYLDANGRPFLNKEGILARYVKQRWQPVCHRPKIYKNQSTANLIGQNMCEYFGFANFESSESITVKNSKLETIAWRNFTFHQQTSPTTSLNQGGDLETCLGLYIRCASTLDSSAHAYLTSDSSTGRREHLWPWLAAIFVDGRFRCEALLLDSNWLLSATKCLENVRLDSNYTTAVLGHGSLFRHIDGPHQRISIIDELHPVNNSVSILLHLKNRAHFGRYVQPLFQDKTIYLPGANDTCVAVGVNGNYETGSVFLKPVLENCPNCQRCFVNRSNSERWRNETNWSGTIFCRGRKGWYPAAVFEDNQDCNFTDSQRVTSIEYINPYLMEAMDESRKSVESTCNGFRCSIGNCIPLNRVCDGVPDCRDQDDEEPEYCARFQENCENAVEGCNCTRMELRCRNGKCVDRSAFCDRRNDCFDGSDEPELCTCSEYLKLTSPERVCDGVRHCVDKSDESPDACPCRDSSFRCKTTNGRDICVPQDFVCDGAKDCSGGEDEALCRMLKPFSNDSDSSGEMIRRSYGVWHTECFSSPVSPELASDLCKSMGYSSGDVINGAAATDQPTILKLDNFYITKINDWIWLSLIRGDKPLVTLEKSNETCHRAFLNCEN